VHAGSDAVTDTGTSRAARRYAFSATRRRTTDGSDAGRYDRSAGGASRAADSTANDLAHDASNYATGHPPGIRLGRSRVGRHGHLLGRGVGQRILPGSLRCVAYRLRHERPDVRNFLQCVHAALRTLS
jgi:hypothetical protein